PACGDEESGKRGGAEVSADAGNGDLLRASRSPQTLGRGGVRRLNHIPLVICGAIAVVVAVLIAWTAAERGKAVAVKAEDHGGSARDFALAVAGDKAGYIAPPASPIFNLAKERGYLAAGPSPAGTCGLIKQVAALSGDRVTIGVQGVQVNGVLLKNSAPRPTDEAGRPLSAYELSDYALRSEEVLLMSDYNPASFDGRYFGPLSKTTIQSVIVQVITWK